MSIDRNPPTTPEDQEIYDEALYFVLASIHLNLVTGMSLKNGEMIKNSMLATQQVLSDNPDLAKRIKEKQSLVIANEIARRQEEKAENRTDGNEGK